MTGCHILSSAPSRNATAADLLSWDNLRHSFLHHQRATRFPMPLLHHNKTFLHTTVLQARKPKAENVGTPTREETHPKTPRSVATKRNSKRSTQPSDKTASGTKLLFEDTEDFEFEHGYTMGRVCDRLMEVFMVEKTEESEWRKLLLFTEDWDRIRPYFFKRCKYMEGVETDAIKKANLLSFFKKLEKMDAEMEQHNELLKYVKANWPELDVIVAGRRKDFSNGFFHHVTLLCNSTGRLDKRDELARVAAKCLAVVEAHDRALEDNVAIAIAQQKFDNILKSPSLDDACAKIDELAMKQQLDSTSMLLFAKAWAAAKESTTMTDEMKELMHHLYLVARGHFQRMIPKEIRILQHILSFEDPKQRFAALTEAFCPGDELIEKEKDALHTKPERLLKWIKIILDGYHLNKQSTFMESARQLMNPSIITRLLQLKEIVEDQFL